MSEPRVVESVTNECQLLGREHESSSARAEQLIACLEGEIAKRDAKYQRDVYGLNNEGDPIGGDPAGGYANDNLRLRAELAAIKAQEPVGYQLPPFAQKVIRKLERFQECADDGQGADIGRHWFDLLTQLGLLNRVQRSPALWEITQQGEELLAAPVSEAKAQEEGK